MGDSKNGRRLQRRVTIPATVAAMYSDCVNSLTPAASFASWP
jgi:hypothetical protein